MARQKEMCLQKKWLAKGQDLARRTYLKCRIERKNPIERHCLKILEAEEKNSLGIAVKFKPQLYLINKGFPAESCH